MKTKILIFILVVSLVAAAGVWFGYGSLPPGTSQTDLDNDGIPDWLEILLGLNPNSPSDAAGDIDGDGTLNTNDTSYGYHTIITIYPVNGENIP